ncbi:hypothetical protein M404DRAFT_324788 [Pisolithus tinctorius Marx 270]|uniref:Uncharacterized protein n=1 Tax=Pisolithus tinctorius Marx 270 TaxID=870435 RepID=A0A0C3KGK9_PISTI|nr:hypothetical protein M404DRAFT_324788 [Pisolithus tinctorius Marx 270]
MGKLWRLFAVRPRHEFKRDRTWEITSRGEAEVDSVALSKPWNLRHHTSGQNSLVTFGHLYPGMYPNIFAPRQPALEDSSGWTEIERLYSRALAPFSPVQKSSLCPIFSIWKSITRPIIKANYIWIYLLF